MKRQADAQIEIEIRDLFIFRKSLFYGLASRAFVLKGDTFFWMVTIIDKYHNT